MMSLIHRLLGRLLGRATWPGFIEQDGVSDRRLPGRAASTAFGLAIGLTIGLVLGGACLAGMTGCQKALFSPDEERSPFDRYDTIRGQRAPTYNEDEYGRRKPNVRGRLLTND
ncbi:MAG: hypothetical protein KF787_08595 [Phycisphaeraceae bacterium]|nr:hypothetical protein [Phycisphaerae bacterium]MBX3392694.1 hypothetical protein [Phycisphaeraceae bacterium]HRJ49692.1 hypothetical protein [Phycisphaerales bacterium]